MVEHGPECIRFELAQIRYDRDEHVAETLLVQRQRQMMNTTYEMSVAAPITPTST